jgi:predicted Zn-dependent protease
MNRWGYALILTAMLGGAIAASYGDRDGKVDLSAALAIWGSITRDANQVGLRLTRVSDDEEMKIGGELAWAVPHGTAADDWTPYVNAVGNGLLPYVHRPGIHYRFVVIDESGIIAFAMPGGQVTVSTGLLQFVQSEAELAWVLGHEISHVDLRHCIERYQYELQLRKLGLGRTPAIDVFEIGQSLIASAYTKEQEIEADEQGVRLAIQAGYDPEGGSTWMSRFAALSSDKSATRARTPVDEVSRAVSEALGSYWQSHPPSRERSERMAALVERNHRRLAARDWYVGRTNLERKIAKPQHEFPAERRRF